MCVYWVPHRAYNESNWVLLTIARNLNCNLTNRQTLGLVQKIKYNIIFKSHINIFRYRYRFLPNNLGDYTHIIHVTRPKNHT